MNYVNTIWLWGLAALSIPLLIHLWNRQKMSVLPFGSIRFLSESSSNQSKRIEFNEFWLFVVRALLILLTVMYLAGLFIDQKVEKENWMMIGEGIEVPNDIKKDYDQIMASSKLFENGQGYDSWSFLNQLALQHPEIDSLLWIDNFNELSFLGSIPQLPFYLKLVAKDSQNKKDQLLSGTIRLNYIIKGLNKTDSLLIEKILKTIASYAAIPMEFEKSTDSLHITFSSEKMIIQESDIYFLLSEDLHDVSRNEYVGDKKLILLSHELFDDQRKQQNLLLIIAENIAAFQAPSFELAVDNNSIEIQKSTVTDLRENAKWSYSDELLLMIILALLMIERLIVYRKSIVGE